MIAVTNAALIVTWPEHVTGLQDSVTKDVNKDGVGTRVIRVNVLQFF